MKILLAQKLKQLAVRRFQSSCKDILLVRNMESNFWGNRGNKPVSVQMTICRQHMVYLQRESDLFRSPQFQTIEATIDIELFRRWRSSSRLQIDRKIVARSANYKDDRTRAIKQAIAESEYAFDANQFGHPATVNRREASPSSSRSAFRAFVREILRRSLRDRVNKRREFIVSVHLYVHRMHDRWRETCRNGIDLFFCRPQRERSLLEMRITSKSYLYRILIPNEVQRYLKLNGKRLRK